MHFYISSPDERVVIEAHEPLGVPRIVTSNDGLALELPTREYAMHAVHVEETILWYQDSGICICHKHHHDVLSL